MRVLFWPGKVFVLSSTAKYEYIWLIFLADPFLYPCSSDRDCRDTIFGKCGTDLDSTAPFCECRENGFGECSINKDCCNNMCNGGVCANGGGRQGTVCDQSDGDQSCAQGCTCVPFGNYGYCDC